MQHLIDAFILSRLSFTTRSGSPTISNAGIPRLISISTSTLNEEQTKLLRESSRPFVKTERKKQEDGNICVELPVNENGVVYFELNAGKVNPDRGYDYDRVVSLKA